MFFNVMGNTFYLLKKFMLKTGQELTAQIQVYFVSEVSHICRTHLRHPLGIPTKWHYVNKPMQNSAFFYGLKNIFWMRYRNIFLIYAPDIDFLGSLELPLNIKSSSNEPQKPLFES